MPYKDKEKERENKKKYYEKNKEKFKKYYKKNKEKKREYYQKYREENKEKIKEYDNEYRQTPQGKKCATKKTWKYQGIICDYDHYYNIYLQRTNCYYCNKEFENSFDRCLDHDHEINDNYNVRGIICRGCNIRDVYKKKPEKLK